MSMSVGQLTIATVREILNRILNGPDPTISETEIANVVRQNVIGKATTIIMTSGRTSTDDMDAIMLVTHRCIDLLRQMDELELTFSSAADGTRSVTIRKARNIAIEELIRSVEDAGGRLGQSASLTQGQGWGRDDYRQRGIEGQQESNADILARIRERVNRPEGGDY